MLLAIASLFTAGLLTVLTVAVLRVLVLRGAFGAVAVDLETVDLRGINVFACLLFHYNHKTNLFYLPLHILKQKSPVCQLS